MATFNKRGYKEPKPKAEKVDDVIVPEISTVNEKDNVIITNPTNCCCKGFNKTLVRIITARIMCEK